MRANIRPFDPQAFLAKVGKGRTLTDYKKNQRVFSQGDPADAVFYIQTGKLKLTVVSKQGKEAVVAILEAGDFFGEGCLAGQSLVHVQRRNVRVLNYAAGKGGRDPCAPQRARLF